MENYLSVVLILSLAALCSMAANVAPPATVKLSEVKELPKDSLKGRFGLLLGIAGALLGGGGGYNRGYQQNQFTQVQHTTTTITHFNSQRGYNNAYYNPFFNRFYRSNDNGVLTMVTDAKEAKAIAEIMNPPDNTSAKIKFD